VLTTTGSDGRQVAWDEYGDLSGAPVVFLHGTPGGRLGFAVRDELFRGLGLRVLATDRPGYGGTDPLPGRSVLSHAGDVLAVLDAAGLDRVYVVGGSGGGPHALGVGAEAPSRVLAIGVLVGAVPLRPDEVTGQVRFNQEVMALVDDEPALTAKLEGARTTILRDGIEALLTDAPASDRAARNAVADALAATFADALAPGVDGWRDDYRAIWGTPWGFEPEDVDVPVLWGHGTEDVNVPFAAAKRLADRLPQLDLLVWEGMGHAPGPDQLTEFFSKLVTR
jgi:pimeloyl-ACP methyl ester carboxylesterase